MAYPGSAAGDELYKGLLTETLVFPTFADHFCQVCKIIRPIGFHNDTQPQVHHK